MDGREPMSSAGGIEASSTASTVFVEAIPVRKEPPPETPRDVLRRRWLIVSFWAVVILLGLPIWYKTTAVYRAALPLDRMTAWSESKVCLSERKNYDSFHANVE